MRAVFVLFLLAVVLAAGCGFGKSNESALRLMVQTVEKEATKNPALLGVVYTLRNELDSVHKKRFRENLKRDLETKGAEGRAKYAEMLKAALGETRYRELERIRVEEGYAALFQ